MPRVPAYHFREMPQIFGNWLLSLSGGFHGSSIYTVPKRTARESVCVHRATGQSLHINEAPEYPVIKSLDILQCKFYNSQWTSIHQYILKPSQSPLDTLWKRLFPLSCLFKNTEIWKTINSILRLHMYLFSFSSWKRERIYSRCGSVIPHPAVIHLESKFIFSLFLGKQIGDINSPN